MTLQTHIEETQEYFGPFFPYVVDEKVTDIDYNGRAVWLTTTDGGRTLCEDVLCTEDFIHQFTARVANTVSKPFHKQSPILEAETDTLRITIVHDSVALSGTTISIRKSLPKVRMTRERMLSEGYCLPEIFTLLVHCVRAKMNFVFCGEPGAGKTECAKFFSRFIPASERVITIEDTPEWHYSAISPGADCIELRINAKLDYSAAIKASLRLNPKWMMLSEARSTEVLKLIEGFSTGVCGMTTIHTDDVKKVPDRMVNMAGQSRNEKRLENDIYTFLDVGILIRRQEMTDENGRHFYRRFLDQVAFFFRENEQNHICVILQDGKLVCTELPEEVQRRMRRVGIEDPFSNRPAHLPVKSVDERPADPSMQQEECTAEDFLFQPAGETFFSPEEETLPPEKMQKMKRGTYLGQKNAFG